MRLNIKIFFILLFVFSFSFGQMKSYDYKRELKNVSEQWHKIVLPDEIFGKTSKDLHDIRIFGISPKNDTIEAPYLLRTLKNQIKSKSVEFKILNTSRTDEGYYFTFETSKSTPVNEIKLNFEQKNFDWRIQLEGSQNQNDWFTILENYRILSIENEETDFEFTKLKFQDSKYRYFRVFINTKENPDIQFASISKEETSEGKFKNHTVKTSNIVDKRDAKVTEIDIELRKPVPVSHLKINILNNFDYFRPVTIKYLSDSIKTEVGWKYNYKTLTSETLSSIEENEFTFESTIAQKFKISIYNHNNQALSIDSVEAKTYVHELVTRFTEKATYFLTYGNNEAKRPYYDIERFTDKIPKSLTTLELGEVQNIVKVEQSSPKPLFENKIWLWLMIGLVILLLGWFSVKMMKSN